MGLIYVRAKDVNKTPAHYRWPFHIKLGLVAAPLLRFAEQAKFTEKTVWIVAGGSYANHPLLNALRAVEVTIVSRLRKDAVLSDGPLSTKTLTRGRPRKWG